MRRAIALPLMIALAACGRSEPEPEPTPTPTVAQPRTLVAADLDLSTLGAKIVGPQGPAEAYLFEIDGNQVTATAPFPPQENTAPARTAT